MRHHHTIRKEVEKRKRKGCNWDVRKGNEESENVGSSRAIQGYDTSTSGCFHAICRMESRVGAHQVTIWWRFIISLLMITDQYALVFRLPAWMSGSVVGFYWYIYNQCPWFFFANYNRWENGLGSVMGRNVYFLVWVGSDWSQLLSIRKINIIFLLMVNFLNNLV